MLLYAVCAICLACLLVAKGSAGFLRSRCTPAIDRRVQADLIWNEKLQSLRCGPLTAFVNASANLVSVPFYIATLPIITWLGGEAITRHLLLYMAILNYFGLFGKDLFCAPRPLGCSAPASILQPLLHHIPERERVHNNEYGLPSTHTSQSLGYFVYLALLSSDALHLSRAQTLALAALAVLLGAWVAAGRMYSLMHSLTDVLAGTALTVLTLSTYTALSPTIEAWLMSDAPVGAQTLAACVIAMYCYPRPLKPTPSFEDAVAFLGAAAGFLAGAHSTRGLPPQPALDLAAPAHLRAQALQLLVGAALAYAAKEGSSVTVRPVIVATMARVPLRVRAWWQLPALSAVAGAAPQRGLVRMADSAASLQQLAADQGPWSSPETGEDEAALSSGRVSSADGLSKRLRQRRNDSAFEYWLKPPKSLASSRASSSSSGSETIAEEEFTLPLDHKGRPIDAVQLSRLISYWAVGWTVSELSVHVFGALGILRQVV